MKIKFYSYPLVVTCLTGLLILTTAFDNNGGQSTQNGNGQAAGTTAPGDPHTCSQAGCHGAGNGNSTTGGLADNAGPGGITVTSSPAMVGNTYVPGTVYQMSLTVNETGKTIFGFVVQMLDNSGNTDLHVNNTAGSLTVSDAVHTHTAASFGTGRKDITHNTNGGLSTNSATFRYQWTAPTTGTVNLYSSGTACNHDGLASAVDNVYTKHIQFVPASATGIIENFTSSSISLYPSPAKHQFFISFTAKENENYKIGMYGLDGRLIRDYGDEYTTSILFNKSFNCEDIASGVYLIKITSSQGSITKKISIN